MLERGAAKKLIIYVSEQDRYEGRPVHERLLELFHERGCAGATVTKAVAGFGPHGVFRKRETLAVTEDLPIRIEVVEEATTIERLLPFVYDMVEEGLVELLDTTVIKYARRDEPPGAPPPPHAHVRLEGRAKMLRIFVDESDEWEGAPLHEAIVKRLRMLDIAGATVERGLLGYGASRRVHSRGLLHLSADLPIVITVVDAEERIRRVLPMLDDMVVNGLVVMTDVDIVVYRAGPAGVTAAPGRPSGSPSDQGGAVGGRSGAADPAT